MLRRILGPVQQQIEALLVPWVRRQRTRLRHSRVRNLQRLEARGESLESFVFRDAVAADIPKLAALHVETWAATYPEVKRPPTFQIRESQWREAFAKDDGTWFCIVIERPDHELVGFAKGIIRAGHTGDLNKIYLGWDYHRLGLGRRLVGHVVRRFISRQVTTMTLMADAANPSCAFYDAIGGEVQRDPTGRPRPGSYIWRDLEKLAERCLAEAER